MSRVRNPGQLENLNLPSMMDCIYTQQQVTHITEYGVGSLQSDIESSRHVLHNLFHYLCNKNTVQQDENHMTRTRYTKNSTVDDGIQMHNK